MIDSIWVSAYIYYKSFSADDVVLDFIPQTIKFFEKQNRFISYFFIRYADQLGKHVRLRMLVLKEDEEIVKIDFLNILENFYSGQIEMEKPLVKFVSYVPETTRYGGTVNILVCENYFSLSSETVISVLQSYRTLSYGKKIVIAVQLHYLSLKAFFPKNHRQAILFLKTMIISWDMLKERNISKIQLYRLYDYKYQFFSEILFAVLSPFFENAANNIVAAQYFSKWYSQNAALYSEFTDATDNQLFRKRRLTLKEEIALSLMHMTNNRLGIDNLDEGYIAYLLYRFIKEYSWI